MTLLIKLILLIILIKKTLLQSQEYRRYLTTTEINYAPTEGEALAVAWNLKKARLFLLGCNHFTILVDHKSLVKKFGDKALHEISNQRLLNSKEKTLQYSLTVLYVKGINNYANTLSCTLTVKPIRQMLHNVVN